MKSVLLLLTVLFVQSVEAGIMPASSRMIYRDGDREKTLMLVNTNDYPVLVQSW
ncbi:TPA: molecular chaperone, partial [Escherichia coli]|nr:molecular chaperone [Escherichia coli]HDQ3087512.1 molecular chaperone [Escherichia coli]